MVTVFGIKLKQNIRTSELHSLFCFYLMSQEVRTKKSLIHMLSISFIVIGKVSNFSQHLPRFSTR